MKTITGIFTGLLLLSLLCLCGMAAAQDTPGTDLSGTVLADDIQPYNGPIGADSPLYGLKLALEDMDESFTANETERVDKQMEHAGLRLSELRRALEQNESESAQEALNNYWLKMNLTNVTISRWNSNATGLLHAQEEITRHQFVLEHLLQTHPNNTGLMRAYNNSLDLERKFEIKTEIHFNRTIERDNKTILHAIHLGQKEQDHHGWPIVTPQPDETHTQPSLTETPEHQYGWEKNKNNPGWANATITSHPTPSVTPSWQQGQGQDQQGNHQQGGNPQGGNNNNGNPGKGNPHGK
jgi:hypothetical protein